VIDTETVKGVAADGLIALKSIPYAAAPVGDLCWRLPKPACKRSAAFLAMLMTEACGRCRWTLGTVRPGLAGLAPWQSAFSEANNLPVIFVNLISGFVCLDLLNPPPIRRAILLPYSQLVHPAP
jgi:hypothetical protein